MDTRTKFQVLIDYSHYYGASKTLEDAKKLILNIPSESLINYISGINLNLYLRENDDDESLIYQCGMINYIITQIGGAYKEKFEAIINKRLAANENPIVFWNYTNLKFYDLIFENFNTLPCRKLSSIELQNFLDAYLILNDIATKKNTSVKEDIENAFKNNELENILITNFIYQKDYISSHDYVNQVIRGVYFFKYLESDPKFGPVMDKFYATKKVSHYKEIFKNLFVLTAESKINENHRIQILELKEHLKFHTVTEAYLDSLCITNFNANYKSDDSFSNIRNGFLYKLDTGRYYLLNINFLFDHFYKSQVFAVNSFLKEEKITNEFLAVKGKDFSDKIYFPAVFQTCFPQYVNYFGEQCKNSNNDELCDAYIRDKNNLILIEFKDVLLNAKIKNATDEKSLFDEFNTKFVENKTGSPKGIRQLQAAIKDIETNGVTFDKNLNTKNLNIYPVIVYTDLSFGTDGLNKMYRKKFNDLISPMEISNVTVNELTFINLNFFEQRQDYFADGSDLIFELLDEYNKHILNKKYELTSFEVFSRFFTKENYTLEIRQVKKFLEFQNDISPGTPIS